MSCRKIDSEKCEEVIDSMKLLPKPGDNGYEDMVDSMRADLIRQKETNTLLIVVWPDGTWCHEEDLEEFGWKSDDYNTFRVPTDTSDEEIGIMVVNYYE